MQTGLTVGLTAVFATVAGLAMWPQGPDAAVAEVAKASQAFLAALPPELRTKATRPLADAERTQWNFVPGVYAGVPFGELAEPATRAAHALLHSLLSARGFQKTTAIMQLENVLHELESKDGHDASHRDPGRYTLLVFGEPAADGAFALRLQGHHVSLHFSCAGGHLASGTPQFLGSNPAELRSGAHAGTRILGAEEDLARALLLLCDDAQRARAVIAAVAPADVFLGPARTVDALGEQKGLPASAMTQGQQEVLWRLIEEFVHNLRPEFATTELARIRADFDGVHFAWAGGMEHGQGHYYRLHGRHFAIEYDNTQNDANHVHTVWRDLEHDFGGDVLRQHYEQHKHDPGHGHDEQAPVPAARR